MQLVFKAIRENSKYETGVKISKRVLRQMENTEKDYQALR